MQQAGREAVFACADKPYEGNKHHTAEAHFLKNDLQQSFEVLQLEVSVQLCTLLYMLKVESLTSIFNSWKALSRLSTLSLPVLSVSSKAKQSWTSCFCCLLRRPASKIDGITLSEALNSFECSRPGSHLEQCALCAAAMNS